MLRIIGGEERSRVIVAPPGTDTRPTLARVKDSVFNILRPYIPGARVLDLFAGSGALALESLSRGAVSAVMADNDRRAMAAVARNIQALKYEQRARALQADWRAALARLEDEGARFDLVFLDPPYRMPLSPVLARLDASLLVDADARIVAEHDAKTPPELPPGLMLYDARTYRDTVVSFIQKRPPKGAAP